ncbi:MAG: MarR family transcriptional regulator [Myxococcales bacterium]|nr:MarR family transcriptional regulator [Myxococcales bacterium]
MRLLWAVDHGLNSVSKRMGRELGVTGPQRLVIRIVGRFPGIPAGRLAAVLHVHPSTLTGVLKRLESRGILQRRLDPTDARRSLLSLTARGRTYDEHRSGTVEEAVRRALANVPRHKLFSAQSVLSSLAEELAR